jgi:hypothetical protein
MSIRELLKPKSKSDVLKVLEENSLNPLLIQLIKENDKAYDKFMDVLSEIKKPAKEVVKQLNGMVENDKDFLLNLKS